MKRLWKILNVELPPVFGCFGKAIMAFVYAILLLDVYAIYLQPTLESWLENRHDVAIIGKDHITKSELQSTLQAALWRRGETWESLNDKTKRARRNEALDALIEGHLIQQFAARNKSDSPSLHRESAEAFQQFLKQFPPPDEWKERMEQQGLTETKLRERISQETINLSALENWLAQQAGKVTEVDARAWFDAHKDSLTIPERVRASHIFLTRLADKDTTQNREAEIRELHRKLVAKEATLEELARQFSDDDGCKPHGGDLGWFSRNRVPPEFAEKVFALPVGEISAPFESHLGWHILVVQEKRPARTPEFAEVQNEITALLESQWREAKLKQLVIELRAKANIEKFESRIAKVQP